MKISASRALFTAAIFAVFGDKVVAAQVKRQSGPVDPSTDPDCTVYDTAWAPDNDCAYFAGWWAIPIADFIAWNPSVKSDCSGLKVGNSYCVGVTRKPTSTSKSSTSTGPTTSPKPSPTQPGLIETCTGFYEAIKGDTCDKIVNSFKTFTFEQFKEWNPAVGDECDGLWASTWYCVAVPGTPTRGPTTTGVTPTGTPKPSPTQSGLISTCVRFYQAARGDTCDKIVSAHGGVFTFAQFRTWNPAVGDDCSSLQLGYYYCVGIPGTPTSRPTVTSTGTPKPSPTQDGLISTCIRFYKAVSGDTCDKIVNANGKVFTLAQFITWNPAVGSDCTGLQANVYYCIGIPGTPTTTSKASTSTKGNGISTPTPIQEGMVANCDEFYLVKSGDTCQKIANAKGITLAQFTTWNPEVGGSSCTGLWLNAYVCISIIGHTPTTSKPATTTAKTTTKTTSTSTCATAHPTPTQPGSVCKCARWYLPAANEFCQAIQTKFNITKAQFLAWNPQVGDQCTGLWKDHNVCVKGG